MTMVPEVDAAHPPAALDGTHERALRSWVPGADAHPDFPIQNLPLGVFSPGDGERRPGVAIGDSILDLAAARLAGLLTGEAAEAAALAEGGTLNALMAAGAGPRRELRRQVSDLLRADGGRREEAEPHLHAAASCRMHLPAAIGDYTDFYVGIHHAENIGKQFRPANPLLPNYKHVPIAYHGRASSIRPSGVPVRRPNGQFMPPGAEAPSFGATRRLDYELELGVWIGPGNEPGRPIGIERAAEHIAGFCLLNDWSARDIQAWEYQPLGPFLSKNFGSTISPWIVTPEALAPFRTQGAVRPDGDPAPLPYLDAPQDRRSGGLAMRLEVLVLTERQREAGLPPQPIAVSDTRHMYWTVAQMVAHHTSGGCDLRPGDLLGSGTISGPDAGSAGSMTEATIGGTRPIRLDNGEERGFLEDGDEVILRARASREGFASIGFGDCRARVEEALA